MPKTSIDTETAQVVSLKALAFIVSESSRLQRFLHLTGVSPPALADMAAESSFQRAVLEYLLSDEDLLVQFCSHEGIEPSLPGQASHVLSRL